MGDNMKKIIRICTRVVCSWCGTTISDDGKGGPDSHGMCQKCANDPSKWNK